MPDPKRPDALARLEEWLKATPSDEGHSSQIDRIGREYFFQIEKWWGYGPTLSDAIHAALDKAEAK